MFYDREKIGKGILILLAIVVAGLLLRLYAFENVRQSTESAGLEAAVEKARPYETERQQLQRELSDIGKAAEYTQPYGDFMVGFLVSDVSDLAYIEEKAEAYDFTPVIVLDCTVDWSTNSAIVKAADGDWELMLYAAEFSREVNEDVVWVKEYLEDHNKNLVNVFLLRKNYDIDRNIEMLRKDGFAGYTLYHDTPSSGQMEDGLIYFDYSYIREDNAAIADRLSLCYSQRASSLIMLDMESIRTEMLSEKGVDEILHQAQTLLEEDGHSFATVAQVTHALSQINQTVAEMQSGYTERVAQIQARIQEIENIIRQIYDGWDGE